MYIPHECIPAFKEFGCVMYKLCAWMQVRNIRAQQRCRANRSNNSPEQFIETVQYSQAALIHFPYQLTHFQGHWGALANPTDGRRKKKKTPSTGCSCTAGQCINRQTSSNLGQFQILSSPDLDMIGGKTRTNTGSVWKLTPRRTGVGEVWIWLWAEIINH